MTTTTETVRHDQEDRSVLDGTQLARVAALRQAAAILSSVRASTGFTSSPGVATDDVHAVAEYILTGRWDGTETEIMRTLAGREVLSWSRTDEPTEDPRHDDPANDGALDAKMDADRDD